MTQPPHRPQPRPYVMDLRAGDEFRVDPELVRIDARRPVCTHCGEEFFPGEWRSIDGRCSVCADQVVLLRHWAVAIAVIAVGILVIAIVGWLTAPAPREARHLEVVGGLRGAPSTSDRVGLVADVPSGLSLSPSTVDVRIGAPLEVIRGTATHYCLPGQRGTAFCTRGYGPEDLVAAIDRDLGFSKGDRVKVRFSCGEDCKRSVTVTIVDVCRCPGERLIDLTSGAFRQLAPLGLGVLPVTLELAGADQTLPPTDEEE